MVAIAPRPGAPGTPGTPGPPGPTGPSGSGDLTYLHDQPSALAVWTIDHGLGKEPAVVVMDSAGTLVVGDVSYPTANRVILTFSSAFAGRARLN